MYKNSKIKTKMYNEPGVKSVPQSLMVTDLILRLVPDKIRITIEGIANKKILSLVMIIRVFGKIKENHKKKKGIIAGPTIANLVHNNALSTSLKKSANITLRIQKKIHNANIDNS